MRENYIVKYIVFGEDGRILKHGSMRCKNRLSKFDAMAGLEKYFKATVPGFVKLSVLQCVVEAPEDFLETLLKLTYKK